MAPYKKCQINKRILGMTEKFTLRQSNFKIARMPTVYRLVSLKEPT